MSRPNVLPAIAYARISAEIGVLIGGAGESAGDSGSIAVATTCQGMARRSYLSGFRRTNRGASCQEIGS